MRLIILCLIVSVTIDAIGQTDKIYFKDMTECVADLATQSHKAYLEAKDDKLGRRLYDSLVDFCIRGKFISNYSFRTIDNNTVNTDAINRPILMVTSGSWCAPCWGEIPALNKLAVTYKNKIQIIVLFADTKKKLNKMASKYNSNILLVPSLTDSKDRTSLEISGFKHLLDFPTMYLVDSNKKILDVTRGAAWANDQFTEAEANDFNENKLIAFLQPVLK